MYGHPLVIAGGRGKSGAALLSSRAALRMGAGLVTTAVPESIQPIVAAGQAELMTEPIADRDGHFDGAHAPDALKMLLDGKNALIFGPGIGLTDDTKRLVEWLISDACEPERAMLIDADGLNALAAIGCETLKRARGPVVLTPHPGEAARLLGVTTTTINDDRVTAARTLAERTGATVLIKGARSVIASADGAIYVNSTGNPGMSTPGMGDALSGMVGALLGQHLRPLDALALGVFLHGYAADRVAARMGRIGYIAGDLIDELPAALEALTE
jgi:NAD(P)H-hydrate epimerase